MSSMRQLTILFISTLLMTSCAQSVRQVGTINMMSTRNVDANLKYRPLSSYIGGSNTELKKSRAKTMEDAITQTVKRVPGGEFLMNIKVYMIKNQYFAVEGDVWGSAEAPISYRGFKVGDRIAWKKSDKILNGTIQALKDDKTCYIKQDAEIEKSKEKGKDKVKVEEKTIELAYEILVRAN
ncbi:MAG: hypothetical protein RLZZ628_1800 [Bacteroidota bacterium]